MRTAVPRIASAGAALTAALLAAGCAVGPTIEDERPAAAAPAGRQAAASGGGMGAQTPGPRDGGVPPGPQAPGAAQVPASVPAGPVRLAIGGAEGYDTDGGRLRVVKVLAEGPAASTGLVIVGVHIEIRAGGGGFKPSGLDVALRACPAPGGKCDKPSRTAAGRPYQNFGNIAPGGTTTLVWYFEAPAAQVPRGSVTVTSFVPGDQGAEFSPAPARPGTPAGSGAPAPAASGTAALGR